MINRRRVLLAAALLSSLTSATTMLPRISRVMSQGTVAPCIVQMQKFLREISPPPLSLAQGIVHWTPPPAAVEEAAAALARSSTHAYGPAGGLPQLQAALRAKLQEQNGLTLEGSDVMVTQGANQAFMNVVLTLLCLLYTSPSPRDLSTSRMPSSA